MLISLIRLMLMSLQYNSYVRTTCISIEPRKVHQVILDVSLNHALNNTGSRNPVSRRTGEQVLLSQEDALRELQAYESKIISEGVHESFPKYASERSDCSSFKRSGDLGPFGRGQMQQPFEEAAFALQVGEMSGITSTDSGLHLIYRIE